MGVGVGVVEFVKVKVDSGVETRADESRPPGHNGPDLAAGNATPAIRVGRRRLRRPPQRRAFPDRAHRETSNTRPYQRRAELV